MMKSPRKMKLLKEESKQSKFKKAKIKLKNISKNKAAESPSKKSIVRKIESMKRCMTRDNDRDSVTSSVTPVKKLPMSKSKSKRKIEDNFPRGRQARRSTIFQHMPFKLLTPSPLPQVDEICYKKAKIKKFKTKAISKNDSTLAPSTKMTEAQLRRQITKVLKKINFSSGKDCTISRKTSSKKNVSTIKKSIENKKLRRINTKMKQDIAVQKRRSTLPVFKINIISAEQSLLAPESSKNKSEKSINLKFENEKPRSDDQSKSGFPININLSNNITEESSSQDSSSTATFNDTISGDKNEGQEVLSVSEDLA